MELSNNLEKEANVINGASMAIKRGALNAQMHAQMAGLKLKTLPMRVRYSIAAKKHKNNQQQNTQSSDDVQQSQSPVEQTETVNNVKEAGTMYDAMVKEAYENIVDGFDKEAGPVLDRAGVGVNRFLKRRSENAATRASENEDRSDLSFDQKNRKAAAKNAIKNMRAEDARRYGKDYADLIDLGVAQGKRINADKNEMDKALVDTMLARKAAKAEMDKQMLDAMTARRAAKLDMKARSGADFSDVMGLAADQQKATNDANLARANARRDLGRFYAQNAAERATLADAHRGARLATAEARLADSLDRKAQKVAAYYEEAQLAKEAAEADYEVACAYEDAAYQILDELGLLED
jgi:hypothetical protein